MQICGPQIHEGFVEGAGAIFGHLFFDQGGHLFLDGRRQDVFFNIVETGKNPQDVAVDGGFLLAVGKLKIAPAV